MRARGAASAAAQKAQYDQKQAQAVAARQAYASHIVPGHAVRVRVRVCNSSDRIAAIAARHVAPGLARRRYDAQQTQAMHGTVFGVGGTGRRGTNTLDDNKLADSVGHAYNYQSRTEGSATIRGGKRAASCRSKQSTGGSPRAGFFP